MGLRGGQLERALRKYTWLGLGLVIVGGVAVDADALFGSGSAGSAAARPGQDFAAAASAVPTNRVTGSGTVTLQLRGDTATVTVRATGLLGGSPHLMHIHAKGLGSCPPASAARLHNGHLSISTADGLRYYGRPITSLTEWGSTSGNVPTNINMNLYPASGDIRYSRTVTLAPGLADLIRRGDAVIVVHGIDYNNNHIYDFKALGVSDLDKTLPGEATAPALCGPFVPFPRTASTAGRSEHRGGTTTYVASLEPNAASSTDQPTARLSFVCHIGTTNGTLTASPGGRDWPTRHRA